MSPSEAEIVLEFGLDGFELGPVVLAVWEEFEDDPDEVAVDLHFLNFGTAADDVGLAVGEVELGVHVNDVAGFGERGHIE